MNHSATSLGLCLVGCLLFASCSEPPIIEPPPPPGVVVAMPLRQDVTDYAYFTGVAQASESAEIRTRVEGFLEQSHFEEGAFVKKGDLLYSIEQDPYQAALDQVLARIQQAEAAVELANANFRRAEQLATTGAVTAQEKESRAAEKLTAEAQLSVEKAAESAARIDLGYTTVNAPFPGIIGRNLVDAGNLVGRTENTLLTTIERVTPIHVLFDVPESVLLRILEFQRDGTPLDENVPIFAKLENEPDFAHEGQIDFVDNRVDSDTGTALIRAVFKNDPVYLYPGLFVRLRIPRQTLENAVLVEESAIGTDLAGKFVLTVDQESMVHRRGVELGPLVDGKRTILSGLTHEDRYIRTGLQKARPGLPVTVELDSSPDSPSTSSDNEAT